MKIAEANLAELDDTCWFVLFVLAFSHGHASPLEIRHYLKDAGVSASVAEVDKACSLLFRLGAIATYSRFKDSTRNVYICAPCFDYETLLRLLQRSVAKGWWTIYGLDSNTGLPLPEDSGKGVFRNYFNERDALCLRALLDASGLKFGFDSFYDPSDVFWRCLPFMDKALDETAEWKWSSVPFGPSNPLGLHLRLMSFRLVRGKPLRQMLRGLLADVSRGKLALHEIALCEVVALSVLTGVAADWTAVRSWKVSPSALAFTGIGDCLRKGELITANRLCTAAFKEVGGLTSLETPAVNVLAALVSAFAKPSHSRPILHMRAVCPSASHKFYERSYGERDEVVARNQLLPNFSKLTSGLSVRWDTLREKQFVNNLGYPLESLIGGMKKNNVIDGMKGLLKTVEWALEFGYPTLAGVYLSAFGWALPAASRDAAAALAARITEENGVWLRPFDAASTEWKRLLDTLSERLPKAAAPKAASAAKVKTGRLIWELGFAMNNGGNYVCSRVALKFRGPRAAEDGSDDKPVTYKTVYGGKYDECLTEADKAAVAALNKVGYSGPRGTVAVPAAALEALCGQDNLKTFDDSSDIKDPQPEPGSLVRQEIPVVGKSGAAGEMRLTVPTWAIATCHHYVVRQTSGPDYAFYPIGRDVRGVLDVFGDFGDKGEITLPKEALTSAKPVFRRLAAVLPLQGALANVAGDGGADGMPRVTGDARPLVRLSLEEMRLHVSLKVRPVATAPAVLFDPGVGQPERTLKLAKGPVILVRDLQAEKSGAATVENALAAFEGDREGTGEWQFDEAAASLEALAAIQALGEAAYVEWQPGRKVAVATAAAKPRLDASLGADEWFAVSGEWQLDDGRLVSFAKVIENFDSRVGRFVPIDEKGYLVLNRALLRQLEALRAAGQVRKDKVAVSPAALPMLDGAFASGERDSLRLPKAMSCAAQRIREAFATTPSVPSAFKGTMRPYQEEGYRWLSRLCDCGIGCCLADDMGLGKTIQLIALLAAKRSAGTSLVVAPASVAFNWRNELERFAPSLRVALVGQTAGAGEEDVSEVTKASDVVVTSYGVAASRIESFAAVTWNVVVLDEAQAIKNHLTQRAKSVKELEARFRVAATGTPVENRLTELWSIFDFLNPGMLGGETHFQKELAPRGEATPRLKRLVKPLILRRIKRDVLTDLPEKEEITVPVVLGDEERHAYEATRRAALAKLQGGNDESKIAILAELTRLRRFCCHPSLVLPSLGVGAKLEALERLLADMKENGHRALVFSQFVDFLAIVRTMLERNGWSYRYLDGATSKADREKSVEAFQSGDGDFFLISLKAGGMGLNLTAANYVILLDPWWNPAVENQAADRVHRIGQRLPVTVYRLIAQDTIEEKVVNLHAKKTALAEDILASGAAALSAEAMLGLLEG